MTSLAATVSTRIRSVRYYTFARDVKTLFTFLLVRRYAGASTGYGAASVSATSRLSIARDRRVEAGFWYGGFFRPLPYCVIRKFR